MLFFIILNFELIKTVFSIQTIITNFYTKLINYHTNFFYIALGTLILMDFYIFINITLILQLCLITLINILWVLVSFISKLYLEFVPVTLVLVVYAFLNLTNPIYSLLLLIFIFFQMAFLLFWVKLEFLAMIFLIIYIGAISILFLFVIMMFNLKEITWSTEQSFVTYLQDKFKTLILIKLCLILYNSLKWAEIYMFSKYDFDTTYQILHNIFYMTDILILTNNLYTTHSLLFISLGYVLLASMISAIILSLNLSDNTKLFQK